MIINEDFFDDNAIDTIDDPNNDTITDPNNEPVYTYHLFFLIDSWPLVNWHTEPATYYFKSPQYKSIIESSLLSLQSALDYILHASSIVTDYSTPKFCSTTQEFIQEFPFLDNTPSFEYGQPIFTNAKSISLETTINLSKRKTTKSVTKLFYSFWRLQLIFDYLITEKLPTGMNEAPYINLGVFRKNPNKKANLYGLLPSKKKINSASSELINVLCYKDETDK